MDDFIGISIVGVILSFIINWGKEYFGTESNATKGITIALSVVVGLVYVYFRSTLWWESILTVLGSASAVYAFFLKK